MKFWARTIAIIVAGIAHGATAHAFDLTVLGDQGNLPGVNELAAYERSQQ